MENIDNLNKFWYKKKVFITGHTGFKGSWLSIVLKYLKSNIYGYSLKPKKNSLFKLSKIEKKLSSNTYSDINDLTKLKKKIKSIKPDIIFHLAAQPLVLDSYKRPIETFNTNIIGTLNVLECAREVNSIKSIIIITTDKVYKIKKNNKTYNELDELGGLDPYSASKVGSEIIVNSYIKSFFQKTRLKNKISTARAGNVIGGGDFSTNRLIPDIVSSIKNKKKLIVRNPNHVRPWQHVLDPLMGYLILAEKQYKNPINTRGYAWNFGPQKKNFKKVIDIVKFIKKIHNFNYIFLKSKKINETQILKLNSNKAIKKLKWISKWNLTQTLKNTLEWNSLVNKGLSAKEACEKQFLMYINKNKN